jgi:hypothetical protein
MYEKQVHKDGIRRTVMTSTGNSTERHFEKHELRKMFTLGEAGHCDVLKRLEQEGKTTPSLPDDVMALFVHSGVQSVVGTSSHDIVYNASRSSTTTQGRGSNGNPFSENPKVVATTARDPSPPKIQKTKSIGRSQIVLSKALVENENIPHNKQGITTAPFNDTARQPETSEQHDSRIRNPKAALIRANGLHDLGKIESAMSILMDLLEEKKYGSLDKETKIQVHERIATNAEKLRWL